MANIKYQTLPLADAQIIDGFHEIWEAVGSPPTASFSISLFESSSGPAAVTGLMPTFESNPLVASIRDSCVIVSRSMTLSVQEPQAFSVLVAHTKPPEASGDHVEVHVTDQLAIEKKTELLISIRRVFRHFEFPAEIEKTLGPALTEFHRRREESLLRLETISQTLIEENTAYRAMVDVESQQERSKLREELAEKEREMKAEYQNRRGELSRKEEELAAEKKKLDDRSSTHARRQLRQDLKTSLGGRAKHFGLTAGTNKKRWPTHGVFWLLMGATGYNAWHALQSLTALATLAGGATLMEFAVSALSFIGAVAFYIRWNDAWAQQHAAEEFKAQRLELDIDRASWVVEVALEWKEEKGSQIPAELLDRLTNGLFTFDDAVRRARHPAEDVLGTLLGASTALKVHVPGGEVSYDRRGVKRVLEAKGDGDA